MSRAFTLIELLIVIGIIAILAIVVFLVLNPSQLLMQSRDSNRVSDMASLNSALGIYSAQGGNSLGSPNIVYISIPDPTATSSAGDQCQGLALPTAPSGTNYFCGASSTYRNVNGTGWIPLNLTTLAGGSPLGQLPIDPVNQSSSNLYYSYATNGTQFVVTALPESQKYKTQYTISPSILDYPEVIAQGTNLTISPLFSQTGLVGYWPMDEGSGSSTADASRNGNGGNWSGTAPYYAGGKVGPYAGNFNGSDNQINITVPQVNAAVDTVSFWMNTKTTGPVAFNIGTFSYYLFSASCSGINMGGDVFGGALPGTNQWIFVTMVLYNGTYASNSTTLYYNGLPFNASICNGISASASPNSTVVIGAYSGGGLNFNGSLGDVRVYNRALSAAEIQALYNAQK